MSKEKMFSGLNNQEWESVLEPQNEYLRDNYGYSILYDETGYSHRMIVKLLFIRMNYAKAYIYNIRFLCLYIESLYVYGSGFTFQSSRG